MKDKTPFGINTTKRSVSNGGEKELFQEYKIGDSGTVELVDYMGGDAMIERVASSGHATRIFPEKPRREEFLNYIKDNGILMPFKSTQLKFCIQSPIETALSFVYEGRASVNEYSGRYSIMLDSFHVPDIDEKAKNLIIQARENASKNYNELIKMDLARELARAGLGINNDTRYFWKIDLLSLSNFLENQKVNPSMSKNTREYLEQVDYIADRVAPLAWRTLSRRNAYHYNPIALTMPSDEEIVDPPLSPASWSESKTKRVIVPDLEDILFQSESFLDHGEFQVVDYMGDDNSAAEAARTSYGEGTKTLQDNKNLIRSLIRDKHTSPIEMMELAFESKTPIFVDPRQAGRHRTLDTDGFMGHMPIGSQFYMPSDEELKYQDRLNRQGRGKDMEADEKERVLSLLNDTYATELKISRGLREEGEDEGIIRAVKGVGFYTRRWRTGDSHNLNHFLRLRLDPHAQKEIREYAKMVDKAHKLHTPIVNEALHTYIINGMDLSEKEVKLLNGMIGGIDLDNLDNFKGVGFVIKDKTGEQRLSREGMAFKSKIERLLEN